jgi:hypothetical protein
MALKIESPFSYFPDDDGQPLENGSIYVGVENQNPEVHPITVYFDEALTIPAAQPIKVEAGYAVRNGSPAVIYTAENDFSITIRDRHNRIVVTALSASSLADIESQLAATTGASLIGWIRNAANAVATTLAKWMQRSTPSVFDWMTDAEVTDVTSRTASLDVSDAIINAIADMGENSTLYFPAGRYFVTKTITVSDNRMHLIGAGAKATEILFDPTADDTCFEFSAGASMLVQGSIRGFGFYSDDSTYSKIAIDLVDTSGYLVEDIIVSGGVEAIPGTVFWSGGTSSVGIRTRGRELTKISRVYLAADNPIYIGQNPNFSIDSDHCHFEDCSLPAVDAAYIVEDGCNVTNLIIDGYQSWPLGVDGFRWIDTTTVGQSQSIKSCNVRSEQGTTTTGWVMDVQHNTGIQSFLIDNCHVGTERNGYRFRRVQGLSVRNNISRGGVGRTALDVDSTVNGIDLQNCLWQVGGTATMTGQKILWANTVSAAGAPLPPSAVYQTTALANLKYVTEAANGGYQVTVANGATIELGTNTMAGMLDVIDSEYLSATFNLRGTLTAVSEVSDPIGAFSITAGTATSTNVYWDAGTLRYRLQNNRGASRNYLIVLRGTYTSF